MPKGKRLKVLLVYHAAALEPSRKIFEALAAHKEIVLRVLGPRKGYNPFRNLVLEIPKPYRGKYHLVTGHVYKAMQDFSGPYLTGLLREILCFKPHIIHVMNEASSHVHVQALLYRNIFSPDAKVLFYGFENILQAPSSLRSRWKWDFICRNGNGGGYANTEGRDALVKLGYPPDNLRVTYWGVPLDNFKPNRNTKLRTQLGYDKDFVIGYIGRFVPEKGLHNLLTALTLLPSSVKCLCVGDGPWVPEFRSRVRTLDLEGRVSSFARVPNQQVAAYLNALDVLVFPSETTPTWKEQFGRGIVEAMACGIPVIGSDSGAIPEIIGDAGLIFAERSPEYLSQAVLRLKTSPELLQKLSSNGLRRAREHFGCVTFAQKLCGLYTSVVGLL